MSAELRMGTPPGRWVLFATVLGTSLAFLDATAVNIALRAIGTDFGADLAALQWTINAYTLTLASLILLGGSLGDRSAGAVSSCSASCGSPSPRCSAGSHPTSGA